MTIDEFNALAETQNFQCDICKERAVKVVDHCHKTGRNRSLLCVSCNLGLGNFQDNPEILTRAIAYLRKHGD